MSDRDYRTAAAAMLNPRASYRDILAAEVVLEIIIKSSSDVIPRELWLRWKFWGGICERLVRCTERDELDAIRRRVAQEPEERYHLPHLMRGACGHLLGMPGVP